MAAKPTFGVLCPGMSLRPANNQQLTKLAPTGEQATDGALQGYVGGGLASNQGGIATVI